MRGLTLARRLATAAAVGMFVVLLMGATVTNTGSGEGCGKSWPLCHGQFVPAYAFETLVEYSHRLVTSVEGLLLLAASVAAFRFRRALPELKLFIPLTIFTLLLQSGLGAAAVMWPQDPAVMAAHFGISLVAFGGVLLMARVLREGPDRPPRDDAAVPPAFRAFLLLTIVAVIGIGYLGAYLRHSDAVLACTGWPLCNGQVVPVLTGPVGVNFLHRQAALGGMLLIGGGALWARRFQARRPDLARPLLLASGLVLAQALSGAAVVVTGVSTGSALAHAALMALLFVTLADAVRLALPQPRPHAAVRGADAIPDEAAGARGLGTSTTTTVWRASAPHAESQSFEWAQGSTRSMPNVGGPAQPRSEPAPWSRVDGLPQ